MHITPEVASFSNISSLTKDRRPSSQTSTTTHSTVITEDQSTQAYNSVDSTVATHVDHLNTSLDDSFYKSFIHPSFGPNEGLDRYTTLISATIAPSIIDIQDVRNHILALHKDLDTIADEENVGCSSGYMCTRTRYI